MSRPTITDEQVAKATQLLRDGYSLAGAARHLDLDAPGYHALKKRLKENLREEFPTLMERKGKYHQQLKQEPAEPKVGDA